MTPMCALKIIVLIILILKEPLQREIASEQDLYTRVVVALQLHY